MSEQYELIVVLKSDGSEQESNKELEKVLSSVQSVGGKIDRADVWGRRKLAYPIKKQQFGYYALYIITCDTQAISKLERELRINDSVLRYMTVKKDHLAPDLSEVARKNNTDYALGEPQFDPSKQQGGFGGGFQNRGDDRADY